MRRLSRCDHLELSYLRFRGLTIAAIADRMGVTENAVLYRIRKYQLNRTFDQVEAVRLELLATFRETSRRLLSADISDAEYVRLCNSQAKQAHALLRVLPDQDEKGEEIVGKSMQADGSSMDMMNDEDMRNEIRRLVGLDTKGLDGTKDSPVSYTHLTLPTIYSV